jgi:hydroxyethylthiazole kinase-like uncharacterized protein yjeF
MSSRRWTAADAAAWITVPRADDDKYSRGVLGIAAGSDRYPGAAVLAVEAAMRTGVGMVRLDAPASVASLALQRRPEVVLGGGRAQAWVAGPGMDADDAEAGDRVSAAIAAGVPVVLDAASGARAGDAAGRAIVTPHAGELARILGIDRADVLADPVASATAASRRLGVVVLLKGSTTRVVRADDVIAVDEAPAWLATAGAGDALAGILGALLATRAARGDLDQDALAALAATAAFVHGRAAGIASAGGPLTILGVCAAVPAVIRELAG